MNNFISPARGRHAVGLVRYLFGPGSSGEHTDQRIIAADSVLGYADGVRLDHVDDTHLVYALGRDMDSHRVLLQAHPAGGWVWHCAISLPPEEAGHLDDEQWAHIARTAITCLCFDADSAAGRVPCRWLAVHHGLSTGGNDHIHLMVNLVREDATTASTWNDRRTMSRLCADMEMRYGLRRVEGRPGRGMPGYSKAEHQRLKAGLQLHRHRAARIVRACALAAVSEAEFVALVRDCGLQVRPRYSADWAAVTGYSVGVADEHGTVAWYGAGGRLAADLTLPRLREHWPSPTPHAAAGALAEWRRPSAAGRRRPQAKASAGSWITAAGRIEQLAHRLADTPHDDATTWSAAGRDAAAVAAALATRMEPSAGPVTELADLLARAAQTPSTRLRSDVLGDEMRSAVTVAHQAPHSPVWTVLLHAVTALAEAIAARRQTGQPALAAELAAAVPRVQVAYPPPSARLLAAYHRPGSAAAKPAPAARPPAAGPPRPGRRPGPAR
ncbi:relaxase/mobilization nuclease domain-containing protein [Sphaerisporangium rhizosphaerae]|uniref:Relaxase/mobilization nuclease domain-containing protein n=1 Tax=Sphaerisporangium rhizosphaerae TaxID=2269375 RepID=A0ABW2PD94_9ACTN